MRISEVNKKMKNAIFDTAMSCFYKNYNYVLPNVWIGCFERDIIVINNNTDYWNEYEVKISRNDLFNDFKKRAMAGFKQYTYKHEQMQKETDVSPNRFFFITPPYMVTKEEIPDYVGLIYCDGNSMNLIKTGKLIHREKITLQQRLYILDKSYHRYHNINHKLKRLKKIKAIQGVTQEEIEYQMQ